MIGIHLGYILDVFGIYWKTFLVETIFENYAWGLFFNVQYVIGDSICYCLKAKRNTNLSFSLRWGISKVKLHFVKMKQKNKLMFKDIKTKRLNSPAATPNNNRSIATSDVLNVRHWLERLKISLLAKAHHKLSLRGMIVAVAGKKIHQLKSILCIICTRNFGT